jgi:O-glycosyl hydrolase
MGVPLDVLSIQNEPNWEPDYESCKWTVAEMRDFLKVLGNRFALKGAKVKVLAPEDENLKEDMVAEILADKEAAAVLSIVGLHQYEGAYDKTGKAGAEAMPAVLASGKRLWETEVSGSGPEMPRGDGIENALFYGRMIHYDMTLAQTNAFLYWWLWEENNKKTHPGSLIQHDNGTVNAAKRLFVLGQYSKFVRPGWIRAGAGKEANTYGEIANGLYISAYRAPGNSPTCPFAVVLVNDSDSAWNVSLALDGVQERKVSGAAGSVSIEGMTFDTYRTSEIEDLKKISSKNKLEKVYCAPRSVTTVYAH